MKKILITGATGFVGSHLVEYLQSMNEYEVFGTNFAGTQNALLDEDHLFPLNLLDEEAIKKVIDQIQPEYVIHLAALSSPHKSKENPFKTISNNIGAQINLFQALIQMEKMPITLVIGSAEEYGQVDQEGKIDENTPLNPCNPYAVSKITQDYLGLQYFNTHKLPVIRIRPFNHTGERRSPTFVLPAFAKQAAEIEVGKKEELEVYGDLEVTRDFTDVKDIVVAYELALTKCTPGEVYNLGSGRGIKISDLLDTILSKSNAEIRVVKDPSQQGSSSVKSLICDNTKFVSATGWETKIPIEDTIERVLNYWRMQVKEA